MNKIILTSAALAILIGCAIHENNTDAVVDTNKSTTIDLDYMNTEVRAQDGSSDRSRDGPGSL